VAKPGWGMDAQSALKLPGVPLVVKSTGVRPLSLQAQAEQELLSLLTTFSAHGGDLKGRGGCCRISPIMA